MKYLEKKIIWDINTRFGKTDGRLIVAYSFNKVSSPYHLFDECGSQLSFDSEVYTKSTIAADFVYTSETNESCEKHSTQR